MATRAKQRVTVLDDECCSTVARLEIDHRIDWAETHLTVFELLDRLCDHDHDLKTREGWALVDGRGKRPFVPPDDPRHPRHAHGDGRSSPTATGVERPRSLPGRVRMPGIR